MYSSMVPTRKNGRSCGAERAYQPYLKRAEALGDGNMTYSLEMLSRDLGAFLLSG